MFYFCLKIFYLICLYLFVLIQFYPGIAVKVGMSDLRHIPCTEKVKDIFENLSYKLLVIVRNI